MVGIMNSISAGSRGGRDRSAAGRCGLRRRPDGTLRGPAPDSHRRFRSGRAIRVRSARVRRRARTNPRRGGRVRQPGEQGPPGTPTSVRDEVRRECFQKGVCVSIVDVVTARQFNLYGELLERIGRSDPALGEQPPNIYAATMRSRSRPQKRSVLDTWLYPLALGQRLPPLPIWLDADLAVSLDLEGSYEDTCRVLRIM